MIEIVEYRDEWPAEFRAIADALRRILGEDALRIDHIGSTAVPGLAAKDIIDVQVTVAELHAALTERLAAAGYRVSEHEADHRPPGMDLPDEQLRKRLVMNRPDHRRANIHLRIDGRFNQRYPLLCRDYLRTHGGAADAYGQLKRALARIVVHDLDAFYDVKDPVFDILMAGATEWARASGWQPGPSDA